MRARPGGTSGFSASFVRRRAGADPDAGSPGVTSPAPGWRALLTQVGTRLSEARLARSMGLAQVEDRTGIPARLLDGLERGDLSGFAGQGEVLTALHRYAELLGLDPAPLWETVVAAIDAASRSAPYSARGERSIVEGIHPMALMGADEYRGTGSTRPLGAFTQTAPVPVIALPTESGASAHHAVSAGLSRPGASARRARPRPLRLIRLATWITGALLLIASAGLAVARTHPSALQAITGRTLASDAKSVRSFFRGIISAPGTAGGGSTSTNNERGAAGGSGSPGGKDRPGPSSSKATSSASHLITTTSSGNSSETVYVHSSSATVVFSAFAPCWLQVTTSSSSASRSSSASGSSAAPPASSGSQNPIFSGIVEGGSHETFALKKGDGLSLEIGASHVLVGLLIRGKPYPDWLFAPKVVPFALRLYATG